MKTYASMTRRGFVKRAVALGAAPLILPSILHAGDSSPNHKITLGFIGTGTQGAGLMRGFLPRDDVRVLAVCEVDSDRRAHAREMVKTAYASQPGSACAAYDDFRELLARKDIDGVVIATPDHWHALIAIAAAQAGKDIYCEKPMAHTVLEGRAMVNAVRSNQRILQVGSMQRSMKEFRVACELVRNGALGAVKKVNVAVGAPSVPCDLPPEAEQAGLDWNLWLGPAPTRAYNSVLSPRGVHKHFPLWRNYREYGGGDVADWGAHHFDIVQWAFGFDETGPTEFVAAETAQAKEGVRLRYASGLEVTHVAGNGITFFGEKGKIYVNRGKFQLWLDGQLKTDDVREASLVAKDLLPANAVKLYESSNQLSDWLTCMRTRKLPICDVETGHRTASICNLVNATYANHQTIKWNPATEQFTDGTGDAAWLTRTYRDPWKLS